jgi:hypothetical protein
VLLFNGYRVSVWEDKHVLFFWFFVGVFWWDWGLNSGLQVGKVGALSLEPDLYSLLSD